VSKPQQPKEKRDSFELFDLRVEWVGDGPCWCKAKAGDYFDMQGEQLHFPAGQSWSIYTLASLLPILPAKQRPCHPNDWMSTDALVACPDPNCHARFKISRTASRQFSHAQVTAVPLSTPIDKPSKPD
jgi:uncharacterized repeat protein (TIGR04076 family)